MGLKEKTINLNEKLKKNFSKNKETLNKVKENLGKKIKSISENKDNFSRVKENIEKKIKNFFDWVKGAELVELEKCDTTDDPVRPELSNEFRTSFGRKIYGVKYQGEIHAVMCFAFTNEIPKSVIELEQYSKDAFLQSAQRDQNVGKIAIAYTIW